MKKKRIIWKVMVLVAWFLVITGMATLLIAANRKEQEQVCKDVLITIKGSGEKFYIEKSDVKRMIEKAAKGPLTRRPVTAIELGKIEKVLERNEWIKSAELYFDSKDVLHVWVEEREPIARVFTTDGVSFYIDSSGQRMRLLDKVSARVPVVTGFTSNRKWNAKDSLLLNEVKAIAGYVYGHEFWNAQVGQIDITPTQGFELIPVIGDHIIKLGSAEKIDEKLERLFVFYKQVMSKTGFNKYSALDIRYDGQVVAVRKEPTSAIDSIQLQKNIEELMQKNNLQNINEEQLPMDLPLKDTIQRKPILQSDSASAKPNTVVSNTVTSNPNPPKKPATSAPKPVGVKEKPKHPVKQRVKPKAVMPKRMV